MLRIVNRVLLGVVGLVLVVVGGAVLTVGLGVDPPSWWPYDGRGDVLLSDADRTRWRDSGWWWPTVIAVLAVLVLLALWWLTAVLRRHRRALASAGEAMVVRLERTGPLPEYENVGSGEPGDLHQETRRGKEPDQSPPLPPRPQTHSGE